MGPSAVIGDISQFYNAVLLQPEFWQFQKILIKENMDLNAETLVAIIITLIYGVCCVAGQLEEVIKKLAEKIKKESFVDDLSTGGKKEECIRFKGEEDAETLVCNGTIPAILKTGGFEIKAMVVSGESDGKQCWQNVKVNILVV